MPINIPDGLPAMKVLEDENIFVMSEERAQTAWANAFGTV